MIRIEKVSIHGLEETIRGMRNPMNSWDKSDSGICKGGDGIGCENCAKEISCEHTYDHSFQLGKADHELMMKLTAGAPVHAKYRRMITVYLDITAPLYWWKEFDTYKVGTVANSCSTMHKIAEKEFTLEDFSCEHLLDNAVEYNGYVPTAILESIIGALNEFRKDFIESNNKVFWWQMIQLLPSSYNQKRTVMLNYEVLACIYPMRKDHKLDEWCEHKESTCTMNSVGNCKNQKEYLLCEDCSAGKGFCDWIKTLPYSELITGNFEKED